MRRTAIQPPSGRYKIFDVDARTGAWALRFPGLNQIQYDWARIAIKCMAEGKSNYKIAGIYVEFQNVASPGDPGTVPSYSRSEGLEYYTALSGDRDYLRLPLLSTPLASVDPAFSSYFTGDDDDNNAVTFFAQTSGVVGVNGLPFTEDDNSLAVGIALVAIPVLADRSRDIVFSRAYFETAEQVPKADSHHIGVSWTQVFG